MYSSFAIFTWVSYANELLKTNVKIAKLLHIKDKGQTMDNIFLHLQRRLIFPGAHMRRRSVDNFKDLTGIIYERLATASAEKITILGGTPLSLAGDALDSTPAGLHMIYFYGNAASLQETIWEFTLFRMLGCNVWIPDYVGYGLSTGNPSEHGCRETAIAVYKHLTDTINVSPTAILLAGHSLGAAVAIDLATHHPVAGLIALSPFTSLSAMAFLSLQKVAPLPGIGLLISRKFSIFIRKKSNFHNFCHSILSALLIDQFDNLGKISAILCPVLISHGINDSVVPFSMGQQLAVTLGERAIFVPVRSDHNDILTIGDPDLIQNMTNFIQNISPITRDGLF